MGQLGAALDRETAIEIEDLTRDSARARVVSQVVSSSVQTNDTFAGHLMLGPPSASL